MEKEKKEEEKINVNGSEKKGDVGTLNTTDPQEHMEGPISSLMHKAKESFDDEVTKEDVETKKNNF